MPMNYVSDTATGWVEAQRRQERKRVKRILYDTKTIRNQITQLENKVNQIASMAVLRP